MNETVRQALTNAQLYIDDRSYCLIHLPARAITPAAAILAEVGMAFSGLIVDKDEVTLILLEDALEAFAHRLRDHEAQCGYRLLTFDLRLEQTMIGFLSVVSTALAEAQIPIMAFSAYERDHLLVRQEHLEAARQVLHDLKAQAARGSDLDSPSQK